MKRTSVMLLLCLVSCAERAPSSGDQRPSSSVATQRSREISELQRLGLAAEPSSPRQALPEQVRAPERSGDPLVLLGDSEQWRVSARLRIREEERVDPTGTAEELGALRWLRLGDASWVVKGREGGVEDFTRLSAATTAVSERVGSRVVLRYALELEGVAGLRLMDTTLEFLDAAGTPRWRMNAPYAVDAAGVKWPLDLALEGCLADTSSAPPWRRPVIPPGSDACVARLSFSADAAFPVWVDPQWTLTDQLAVARSGFSWRYSDAQQIKVLGGLDGAGLPLDSIEAFDQSTQTWSLAGSLLSPRGEHQALDVGQWVYLIGGAPNVERGKPTQGIWEDRGAPQNTQGCAATLKIIGATLPVYVGSSAANAASARVEYESAAGGWQVAQTTQPVSFRAGAYCVPINTSGVFGILYFGGREPDGTQPTDTWILRADPTLAPEEELARVVWEPGPDLGVAYPEGVFDASLSGEWLVGGEAGGVPLDLTARIVQNVDEVHFEAGPPLPVAVTRPSVVHTNDIIAVTGGQTSDGSFSDATYRFDGSAWSVEGKLNTARAAAALVALREFRAGATGPAGLALIGGRGAAGTLSSTEILGGELGMPCSADSECGSGFCSQGVCCESRCDGDCETCALPIGGGRTGFCQPVPRGYETPQGCESSGSPCERSKLCDGERNCLPASVGTSCGSDCVDGTAVTGLCDGQGSCLVSRVACPGLCFNGLCSSQCVTNADCSDRYECKEGQCTFADCSDCGLYTCDTATQQCRTSCQSDANCDIYAHCDTENEVCVEDRFMGIGTPVGAGCLCRAGTTSARRSPVLLTLVAMIGFAWRRRRSTSPRRSRRWGPPLR